MYVQRILWLSVVMSAIASQSSSFPEQILGFCTSKDEANNIQINCKSDERIAIHEAIFTTSLSAHNHCPFPVPADELKPSKTTDDQQPSCTENVHQAFNAKCSGESSCTFNLKEDHSLKCFEDGFIVVRYICIQEKKLLRFCGLKFTSTYGYFATPGYPEYYPELNCSWSIEVDEGRTVQLKILDADVKPPFVVKRIKLRGYGNYKDLTECVDSLKAYNEETKYLEICGNSIPNLQTIRTSSNHLNVSFNSKGFASRRGILMRYAVQGCPTLDAPRKGHLVYRNNTTAIYACCEKYVFEDTKQMTKYLYCSHGVEWNASLTKCIPAETEISTESTGTSTYLEQKSDVSDTYFSAIIVPVLVMCGLLVINAIIVWTILRFRKRQKIRERNETTVPLNSSQPTNV